MTIEANKAVVRRFYERVIEGQDFDAIDELLAGDFRSVDDLTGEASGDRSEFKRAMVRVREGCPDFRQPVLHWIAEGDMVAARYVFRGTHEGDFFGVPATGKEIAFGGVDIWRVTDGRIAELRFEADFLGVFVRIGVIDKVWDE